MSLTIHPVAVPGQTSIDEAQVARYAELERRHCLQVLGVDDLADSPQAQCVRLADQQDAYKVVLLAQRQSPQSPDTVAGACTFTMSRRDNLALAEGTFLIDPDEDPGEVLPLLWQHVRPVLSDAGRRTVQLWTMHPRNATVPTLVPPTGAGQLPRDGLATALLTAGFTLEQVERHSMLTLDAAVSQVAQQVVLTGQQADGTYELDGWVGATPAGLRDQMAQIRARMSTDIPLGDLQLEPELWDADRVARHDELMTRMGRTRHTTIARHRPSGHVVAYTMIDQLSDRPMVGYQEDTLVHRDHRGHRLGLWVKAANLLQYAEHAPAGTRLHTWNADENEHMLAINDALGYQFRSHEGSWQLVGG